MPKEIQWKLNHGGPIHYLGNRYLTLPNESGNMVPDFALITKIFQVIFHNMPEKKFKKCIEPFAGSASWSFAAMEMELAEEYLINDTDTVLIKALQLIKENPNSLKKQYEQLTKKFESLNEKEIFFIDLIKSYNNSDDDRRALLLPFIVNHSFGGIIFHNEKKELVYYPQTVNEKKLPGHLEKPNLTSVQFAQEVDRISKLLNNNKVTFCSKDFSELLSDIEPGDFVSFNPPYPENTRSSSATMYVEICPFEKLHQSLVFFVKTLDEKHIPYFMTYGLHNPSLKQFVILGEDKQPRHFLHLWSKESLFGPAIDQIYLGSGMKIPDILENTIIPAAVLLEGKEPNTQMLLEKFEQQNLRKGFRKN